MSNLFLKALVITPVVLWGFALPTPNVLAHEVLAQVNPAQLSNVQALGTMARVTSVSQLSDVNSTDWALQALQSLVERYGCLVGYADKTYRGNRALSRDEFAAGLKACLDRMNELLTSATADLVKKDDLVTVQKLQEEFAAELTALRDRVEALDARTATLEKQQFSTTTKLSGEVVFAVSNLFGDDQADGDNDHNDLNADNTIVSDRVRVNFDTSFTGKDRLRVRLEAGNNIRYNAALTGTDMARLGFDTRGGNAIKASVIYYRFPVGDKLTFYIAPLDEASRPFEGTAIDTLWPNLESGGTGSISRFGRMNPLYRQTGDGAYAAFTYRLSKQITLSAGYFANEDDSNNPGEGGFFAGTYTARVHLLFQPLTNLALGLGYSRSYFDNGSGVSGGTGSVLANDPFNGSGTSANTYTAEARYRFSPRVALASWVTWIDTEAKTGMNRGNDAKTLGYAVALVFPDLGKKGNLGAFIIGQPPKVLANSLVGREDPDTSLHLEAFYRIRLTDNIAITPGAFVLTKPNHNDNNDPIFVGTIRTTFTF